MKALDNWLRNANANHRLKSLNANEPTQRIVLTTINSILAHVDHASPENIDGKRSEFAAASTDNTLLSLLAELRLAAKLSRAEVPFRFGALRVAPEPDIVLLDRDLGIELTSRYFDGLQSLHAELEQALSEAKAECMVQLSFSIRPLYIPKETRDHVVQRVTALLGDKNNRTFRIAIPSPREPAEFSAIIVRVDVLPTPPLADHLRVTWTHGPGLGYSLAEAQRQAIWALHGLQKVNQANAMPTVGVVNIAHMGLSWLRPDDVWARDLCNAIPANSPYVAIGMAMPTLDSIDQRIAIAIHPSVESRHVNNVATIAHELGATLAD